MRFLSIRAAVEDLFGHVRDIEYTLKTLPDEISINIDQVLYLSISLNNEFLKDYFRFGEHPAIRISPWTDGEMPHEEIIIPVVFTMGHAAN